MKVLIVTEKCSPNLDQRDGGYRLIESLRRNNEVSVMQFGPNTDSSATWSFDYPFNLTNRFEKRLANASFIAQQVKDVEQYFTHIIFIHISMQFGITSLLLKKDIEVWTFPMFLTPSYIKSGETVPENYFEMEKLTFANSKNIITPSYLEKRQLIEVYSIPSEYIHVVPRGIDTKFLNPKVRIFKEKALFCSVGSIKPQKNILGLVKLFSKIKQKFSNANLKIIGPIQDLKYYTEVISLIKNLFLEKSIEVTGYASPDKLYKIIEDSHIHLSTSTCETFGRAIFETLASGIPNIVKQSGNAAAGFLSNLPYIKFSDNDEVAIEEISRMLINLSKLSTMAMEIGELYNDELLSQMLIAKILQKKVMVISDFDGTLFHKNDDDKTLRCMQAFKKFSTRIICSARPLDDLLQQLNFYNITADWIISYSGAVVSNSDGDVLWYTALNNEDISQMEKLAPDAIRIILDNKILQLLVPQEFIPNDLNGLRVEIYNNTGFIANWAASKLKAIHRLLKYINWDGQIQVFGDGEYDLELINYFDGVLITPSPNNHWHKKEVENV